MFRTSSKGVRHVSCGLIVAATLLVAGCGPGEVFRVDSNEDIGDARPGFDGCRTATGVCTLRAAFEEINARPPGRRYRIELMAEPARYEINPDISSTIGGQTIGGEDGLELSGDHDVSVVYPALNSKATITLPNSGGSGRLFTVFGGHLRLQNLRLTNGNSNSEGGAIYLYVNGRLTVTGCEFDSNHSDIDGGAVFAQEYPSPNDPNPQYDPAYLEEHGRLSEPIIIEDSAFLRNTAQGDGGAIYARSYRPMILEDLTFQDNRAENGGAVAIDGSQSGEVQVARSRFFWNVASDKGGGIYIDRHQEATIKNENLIFMANEAEGDDAGSAIHIAWSTNLTLQAPPREHQTLDVPVEFRNRRNCKRDLSRRDTSCPRHAKQLPVRLAGSAQ